MIMLLLVYFVHMTTQFVMLLFAMELQLPLLFFYNSATSTAVTLFQVYAAK